MNIAISSLRRTTDLATPLPQPDLIRIEDLSIGYGDRTALRNVTLSVPERGITALIGPSGCGKSSLLMALNRMTDLVPGCRLSGRVTAFGEDILAPGVDVTRLRRRIGMVFQRPNPFPTMSIADNVLAGVRLNNRRISKSDADDLVEKSLKGANLWNEVKDRLDRPGSSLSGGQQQRLCIARAIAVEPEVILMDEPCSALDPISTLAIEDLIEELKTDYTIVIVTHNMQQAARCADQVAFFYLGELIEVAPAAQMFTAPRHAKTQEYITGRFG